MNKARTAQTFKIGVAIAAIIILAGKVESEELPSTGHADAFAEGHSSLYVTAQAQLALNLSHDTATNNFFASRPAAQAALQAAINDINAVLAPSSLSGVSPTGSPNVDDIDGFYQSTAVTANWRYSISNASTGSAVSIASPNLAAGTITVYAGMREFLDGTLGQANSQGVGVTMAGSGFGTQLGGALADLKTTSDGYMGRSGGPTMGVLTGTMTLGGVTEGFNLAYGLGMGSISFDHDTNNDGVTDTLSRMDSYWHFDHTTPVVTGKIDFYTVALHELLHLVGVGSSQNWQNLVQGSTWLGPNGIAANGGSGAGLLDLDGDHLADGIMSTNIYTGAAQGAVMDPTLGTGQRKLLTHLDVALINDIGWQKFTPTLVPEPSALLLTSLVSLCLFGRNRPGIPS